jgi:hypothetical protein
MKEDDKLTIMIIAGIIASLIILTVMVRSGLQFIIDVFGLFVVMWIFSFITALFICTLIYFVMIASGVCNDPGHIQ